MRIRYGWELALAALLVIEIVAFGAINPRMLDLNMLLFSTSDFICIGIVALPLTMVVVSGGIDISFGSTIGLCAIALGVLFQSGVPMPLAILLTLLLGALCGLINAGLIIYTFVPRRSGHTGKQQSASGKQIQRAKRNHQRVNFGIDN